MNGAIESRKQSMAYRYRNGGLAYAAGPNNRHEALSGQLLRDGLNGLIASNHTRCPRG